MASTRGIAGTEKAHEGRPGTGEGFRPDVEGLRAVAIVAVVLCHAGIAWLVGGYVGVDVFFVISGFLITGLLIGELGAHGSISLPHFYAARARRILPLAAVLLTVVAVLALLLMSPLRRMEVSSDVVDSALYVVNWHFAAEAVNYFAKGAEPSPVLHLWSLSVEEQFYVLWPGVLLAVAWIGRRLRTPGRVLPGLAIGAIFAASLLLAARQAASDPAAAYFSTFDRAWELALGGILAITLPVLPRPPRALAIALGWAGLAAIAYACLEYTANMQFPGPVALLPTLGAAAVIVAGATAAARTRASAAAPLSLPPVRYIGRISYGWYLWHWPALVFGALLFGPLTPLEGVAAVLVALGPTIVSHQLVEDPLRHWRTLTKVPIKGLAVGCCCMATAVGAGVMLLRTEPHWRTLPEADAPGALNLVNEPRPENVALALRPEPLLTAQNLPAPVGAGCLAGVAGTESGSCEYGDRAAHRALVLFGDSHAMQHFPELLQIAERNEWRLVVLTKRECTPGEQSILGNEGGEYTQCNAWRHNALWRIEATPGAFAVVISGDTAEQPVGPGGKPIGGHAGARLMQAGYERTIRRLQRAGLAVVVIGDTPRAPEDMPSCVSENTNDLAACSFPEPHQWRRGFDLRAARQTGAMAIPIAPEICPGGVCRAVIGNVAVYRDNAHLTADFARTLTFWMEPRLKQAIEGGRDAPRKTIFPARPR
ncbi:MAG: acyltransferase [Actinobacteria bacterium]|nr:acyltransferase [Actinomycetota bacterium]